MLALSQAGAVMPTLRVVGSFRDVRDSWRRIGIPGEADVQAILPPNGRIVGVEIKTGAGRTSKEQNTWRDAFVAAGGLYHLCRFGTADEALSGLRDAIASRRA